MLGRACLECSVGLWRRLSRSEQCLMRSSPDVGATRRCAVVQRDGLTFHMPITTRDADAQRYFDQGMVLAFGFNHAESIRSFRAAQTLDPDCAMCFWGEALATGPNINVTNNGKAVMTSEDRASARAAIDRALTLIDGIHKKSEAGFWRWITVTTDKVRPRATHLIMRGQTRWLKWLMSTPTT